MQTGQTTSTVRNTLRAATQADHDRTEAVFEQLDIYASDRDFAIWLSAMNDMHQRFGPAMDSLSDLINLPPINDLLLVQISQDFARIKGTASEHEFEIYLSNDLDQLMGVAYAIEGSGMGARLLEARAKKAGQLAPGYIQFLSKASLSRWPIFLEALDVRVRDVDAAVSGAQTVFKFLEDRWRGNS